MSFKDMMRSFLFETVDPEIDENEVDTQPLEEEPKPAAPVQSAPVQTPEYMPVSAPVVEPAPQAQLTRDLYVEPTVKAAAKEDLPVADLLDDFSEEEPSRKASKAKAKTRTAMRKPSRHAGKPVREPGNADYSTVLSPIFGNMPEAQKDHGKIHDAINLPEPQDTSDLIRVISPMFGNNIQTRKSKAPAKEAEPAEEAPVAEHAAPEAAPAKASRSGAAPEAREKAESAKASAPASHNARRARISDNYLEAATVGMKSENSASTGTMDLAAYLSRPAKNAKDGSK